MAKNVPDPDSPGKHIDAIELQRRNPYKTLPPVLITNWLKHDLWTRIQAIQLLAGCLPDSHFSITGPKRYLDGTSDVQLSPMVHPMRDEILANIMSLSNWAGLSEVNETKPPQEWLSWAKEKGFTPYWLHHVEHSTVQGIDRASTMNRALFDVEQGALESRRAMGRYTIEEAALLIADDEGERAETIQTKLVKAVEAGALVTYEPGSKVKYVSTTVRTFHEEIYGCDLNDWLEKNEQRLSFRFPDPQPAPAPKREAVRGITKNEVISAFDGMYFDGDKWSKYLGDPPKWLLPCRVARGDKKTSALWNPADIALALLDKNISIKKLDAVFVHLKDWADEWQKKSEISR